MPFEVEIEGSPTVLEFEDGTPDTVVSKVVRRVSTEQQQAEAAATGAKAQQALGWIEPLEQLTIGATPLGLLRSGGRILNYLGKAAGGAMQDVLAQDPTGTRLGAALTGTELPAAMNPAAGDPVKEGLVQAAETTPIVAGSMLAMALGVPPMIALGGPMAVSTFDQAKERGATDGQAAAQAAFAGATGTVIPGVAAAGAKGAAAALGQAVQRGLLSGRATTVQKAVEVLGAQGALQVFMEGLNLPEYVAASPEERGNMLKRNLTANVAFLAMDVPNVFSGRPSLTQQREFAKVGEVLERLEQTPEGVQALREFIDELVVESEATTQRALVPEAKPSEPTTPKEVKPDEAQGQKEEVQVRETHAAELEEALESPGGQRPLGAPTIAPETLPPAASGTLAPRVKARMQIEEVREGLAGMIEAVGGTPVLRSRRFGQKALGIFKPFERVVRMRDMNQLPVLTHEVAHHVSRQLFDGKLKSKVPAAIAAELRTLGKALYNGRKAAGGYTEEGWAEFFRYYLTTDQAKTEAPKVTEWFEKTFLPGQPKLAEAVGEARRRLDVWRQLDVRERWRQRPHDTPVERDVKALRRSFTFQGAMEAGAPLRALSQAAEAVLGGPLAPANNPYSLFKAQRGRGGSVVHTMMDDAMVDIFYQKTGGKSLREELVPLLRNLRPGESPSQRIADFFHFLYARRALERWGKGKNPGMPEDEARRLYDSTVNDDILLAAGGYDRWWSGVLDYVASASPNMAALVESIRDGSTDYAPLARLLDDQIVSPGGLGKNPGTSNPFRAFRGSDKSVLAIQTQTALSAEKMINAAHREQVLEAIVQLSKKVPQLGQFIERIPPEKRKQVVNIEKIRESLEAQGVDTSPIPDDTLLTFWQASDQPSGSAPIIIRRQRAQPGQPAQPAEWYQINRNLYDALAGMRPMDLGPVGNLINMVARTVRLGTTALRPSFGLVTNPVVDLPTALMQARTAANPFGFLKDYIAGIGHMAASGLAGHTTPLYDAYKRAGVGGSTFLGADTSGARTAGKRLFRGRIMSRVTTPLETAREFFSFMEGGPRLAEFARVGKEMGWVPGTVQTPDQAIQMLIAASEVTTDFRARGDMGGDTLLAAFNRGAPFNMAALQGIRTFGRSALRAAKSPRFAAQLALNGLGFITLPTLVNWLMNKDKEWYRALPPGERYGNWNVEKDNGEIVQIRKPREWGLVFAAIPEALLDRAWGQDPIKTKELIQHIYHTTNPYSAPVVWQTLKEQWKNKVEFFDKPIVPQHMLDKLPGAQVSPHSTVLAKKLGELFPKSISPLRVDHAVRSLAGGAPMDALQWLGLADKQALRGAESADLPVAGRLFRRGGTFSAANRWLEEAYEIGTGWQRHLNTQEEFPMDARSLGNAKMATETLDAIRTVQQLIEMLPTPEARRRGYATIMPRVREYVQKMHREKALPQDRTLPPRQEPMDLRIQRSLSQPSPAQP